MDKVGLRQVCYQERVAMLIAARDGEILPVARPGEVENAVGKIAKFLRPAAGDGLPPQARSVEWSGGVIERHGIG